MPKVTDFLWHACHKLLDKNIRQTASMVKGILTFIAQSCHITCRRGWMHLQSSLVQNKLVKTDPTSRYAVTGHIVALAIPIPTAQPIDRFAYQTHGFYSAAIKFFAYCTESEIKLAGCEMFHCTRIAHDQIGVISNAVVPVLGLARIAKFSLINTITY